MGTERIVIVIDGLVLHACSSSDSVVLLVLGCALKVS